MPSIMTTKKVEEIIIYESPDGGKTVYVRNSLSGERKIVKIDESKIKEFRWFKWKEILKLSENNPSLANAIKQAELIYEIIKQEKND